MKEAFAAIPVKAHDARVWDEAFLAEPFPQVGKSLHINSFGLKNKGLVEASKV